MCIPLSYVVQSSWVVMRSLSLEREKRILCFNHISSRILNGLLYHSFLQLTNVMIVLALTLMPTSLFLKDTLSFIICSVCLFGGFWTMMRG